ncbi:hypothetical protein KKA08_07660 [bacterium]|nr:hypothetical protein [bacterium]
MARRTRLIRYFDWTVIQSGSNRSRKQSVSNYKEKMALSLQYTLEIDNFGDYGLKQHEICKDSLSS